METVRFRNDNRQRKHLLVPESFQHPAKMHLGMLTEIVERYTKEGDWVLDPMAGVGSSMVAALMGRNVICVELEQWMVDIMVPSWEKMRQNPMLGCELGQVVIVQGDSRDLSWLGSTEAIITSPPFEDQNPHHGGGHTDFSPVGGIGHEKVIQGGYTRQVQAVVTSPSYEGTNIGRTESLGEAPFGGPNSQARGQGYSRPAAIVTSPPYEATLVDGETPNETKALAREARARERHPERPEWKGYAGQPSNIGNLRAAAYWEAMKQVYSECHRVLKPGGVMVLVLKGFTRDGAYVNLPAETASLVSDLGFTLFDHWRRELWSLSFWRILEATDKVEEVVAKTKGMFDVDIQEVKRMKRVLNGKMDERLRYEEVIAFRKGDS